MLERGTSTLTAFEMIVSIALGYFCGAIPFGLMLTKAAGLGDIRRIGSGNIGATNVLRTGNKLVAALTLLADGLKGAVPVLTITMFYGVTAAILTGFAAFLGHLFPVWLGFKGGKGVATYIGVLFGLFWPLGTIFLAMWLAMAILFRISSLSALTASALTPLWALLFGRGDLALASLVLSAAIWFTHRANIARLLKGEEPKISFAKQA
ncbi:MAG: glycerol-3-phosphate 1-O-acyltransferase PlsY [Aestuariivirga sp.]